MTITMTENEAMFKHIRRMPVGQLKAMPDDELQKIREVLVTEVRKSPAPSNGSTGLSSSRPSNVRSRRNLMRMITLKWISRRHPKSCP